MTAYGGGQKDFIVIARYDEVITLVGVKLQRFADYGYKLVS